MQQIFIKGFPGDAVVKNPPCQGYTMEKRQPMQFYIQFKKDLMDHPPICSLEGAVSVPMAT